MTNISCEETFFSVQTDGEVMWCDLNSQQQSIHAGLLTWWIALSAVSLFYCKEAIQLLKSPVFSRNQKTVRACAVLYVFVCAFRAIWLRRDVERICFFDTWLSYPVVGRTLATFAELAFSHQIGSALHDLATQLNCFKLRALTNLLVPSIAIAQTCCWMGVTTQRQIWHGIEESIWMFTMQISGLVALYLAKEIGLHHKRIDNARSIKLKLRIAFLVSVVFSIFMFLVDIPMYVERYYMDEGNNMTYSSVVDGLSNAAGCAEVSKQLVHWSPEMPWVTGYFVFGPYMSLNLINIPTLFKPEKKNQ